MRKHLLFFGIAALLLSACATRPMRVLTTRAAPINIPQTIQKVVLVNRSQGDGSGAVEGFFSGELPGSDKALAQECLGGLNRTLNLSSRLKTSLHDQVLPASDGASMQFGNYLDWATVERICTAAEADALLALEFFDSDFTLTPPVPRPGASSPTFDTRASARARAGFRIYDPKTKAIVYEDQFRHSRTWTASGATMMEAASRLLRRNDALRQISFGLGEAFARQIVPLNYWESRRMYRGGNDMNLRRGERLALTAQWSQAAEVWEQCYNQASKASVLAASAYNLALAYEVLGDLDKAKYWIGQSYVAAGRRKALRYSELIDRLIINKRRLEEQIPN